MNILFLFLLYALAFLATVSRAEDGPLTVESCAAGFQRLNFSPDFLDRYSEFFDDDSVVILSEAGRYVGPSDIAEYVGFANDVSPYIESAVDTFSRTSLAAFDPAAQTCTFLFSSVTRYVMDEILVTPLSWDIAVALKVQ